MVLLVVLIENRERVSQYPVASSYHVIISEFMIACSSQDTENTLTSHIPEMVLRLREIGRFNPTQPIRDQSSAFCSFLSRCGIC